MIATAIAGEPRLERAEVRAHDRRHVGVDDRRAPALVLAVLGQHARATPRRSSPAASQRRREPRFVRRIARRRAAGRRRRRRARRADAGDDARDLAVARAGSAAARPRRAARATPNVERGIDQRPAVLRASGRRARRRVCRPMRTTSSKPAVATSATRAPRALEHGVGRDGRPVDDVETGARAAATSAMPSTIARDGSSGVERTLCTRDALGAEAHQVGERAARVDADPDHGRPGDAGAAAVRVADQPEPVMVSPLTRPA